MRTGTRLFQTAQREGQMFGTEDWAWMGIQQFYEGEVFESIDFTWRVHVATDSTNAAYSKAAMALVMTYSGDPQQVPPTPENPLNVLLANDYLVYTMNTPVLAWPYDITGDDPMFWPRDAQQRWIVDTPRWISTRAALWFVYSNEIPKPTNDVGPWKMYAKAGYRLLSRSKPA